MIKYLEPSSNGCIDDVNDTIEYTGDFTALPYELGLRPSTSLRCGDLTSQSALWSPISKLDTTDADADADSDYSPLVRYGFERQSFIPESLHFRQALSTPVQPHGIFGIPVELK